MWAGCNLIFVLRSLFFLCSACVLHGRGFFFSSKPAHFTFFWEVVVGLGKFWSKQVSVEFKAFGVVAPEEIREWLKQ